MREKNHERFEKFLRFDDHSEPIFADKSQFLMDEISEEDICFWVDPLDGTGGFINGHTEHVTCNIGISVKGKPLFGVIGKPFPYRKHVSTTFVGGLSFGLF